MPELTWRRVVLWLTAAISGFALAYVAYVHVVASSRRMSPDVRDFREGFGDSSTAPAGYTVRKRGDLTASFRDGQLVIDGSGHAGDEVVLVGPTRRFDDGVLTLKFRAPAGEGIETFVGLEQPGSGRTVRAAFIGGATPFVHIGGDTTGPFRAGTVGEDSRVEVAAGEWHTLSMQFTPVYGMMTVSLDGHPYTSAHVGWFQGTEARVVFGSRLRQDVEHARCELESISMQTLDWATLRSFDEKFSGDFVDVKRWMFQFPDPDLGTMDVGIQKGKGLFLDARMRGIIVDPVFVFLVRTFPFPLRTMHMSAELTVEELDDASLFIGLMGASAWSNADRVFDVGVTRRKATANVFSAGGWTGDGTLRFDRGADVTLPRRLSVELRYDAATSMGQATIDGKVFDEHLLDLKPLDIVAVRIGAIGHTADAKARLHLHRIEVEMH